LGLFFDREAIKNNPIYLFGEFFMQTDLRNRDLIGDLDFSKEEVETVLDVAFDLKRKRALGELHPYLRDKVLAMLFFFSSTRTRASFEAGMAQLGGHAQFIESKTTQIAMRYTG
jgi:N-acetylornithine carbamoyltransferase